MEIGQTVKLSPFHGLFQENLVVWKCLLWTAGVCGDILFQENLVVWKSIPQGNRRNLIQSFRRT